MERKEAVYKGLEFIPVFYEDPSLTSPDYFQISEFPTKLTAGKNLFKLRGHPTNLTTGGALGIEVLDYNGDPIYTEVVDFIDEDKSRVIAIYIYEDTSPGDCTVTLVAEASVIEGVPTPQEYQGRVNIRWSRTTPVNPNISNNSEIIFETLPDVTIREQVGVQLDRTYSNGQFPTYGTGRATLYTYNGQPAVEIVGATLTTDMKTGTITVASPINPTPTPEYPVVTTPYVSTIKKILTPTTALLDKEYTVLSSESIFPHTYSSFEPSAYSITYEATPTYTETENSQSYAYIEVKDLEPATGDVNRIKVYTNNKGTAGTFELVNDVELEETEIFVPSTSSLFPDVSIGELKSQSTIDTYWEGHTYFGNTETTAPNLPYTVTNIDAAVFIRSTADISPKNHVLTFQNKSAYNGVFVKDSAYKVTFDAHGQKSSFSNFVDPVLAVYMSGSAFDYDPTDLLNQELPVTLGKRVGEIRIDADSQVILDQTFSFNADNTGNGSIIFVVEGGAFNVADIHVTSDNDAGYTPNYNRIKTFIETTHKIDNQISFKLEYYNVDGVASKQVTFVNNLDWEGGNRYVDGDFSMLTGSLYVADSINSGVAITGNAGTGFIRSLGYQGFESGFPGFLLFSGSALAGSAGTKGGVDYSGVGLELYAHTGSYFRYSTTDSEIDVRTDKFFFGNISGSFISGSNGLLQISSSLFSVDPQGNITSSGGTIGGSIITATTLKSNINLSSPDSAPSFQINSGGAISGSDLYVRKVFENPGSGANQKFELIDTVIGKTIARNIGRQIVSDTTEYERKNVDDNGTFNTVKSYVATLLPFEDTILIYADIQGFNLDSAGATTCSPDAKFTIARSVTGSFTNSATNGYDEWETADDMKTFNLGSISESDNYKTFSAGPGTQEGEYDVDSADQACQVKIDLQLMVDTSTGDQSNNKGIKIKNISIIATSGFGATFAGSINPITR